MMKNLDEMGEVRKLDKVTIGELRQILGEYPDDTRLSFWFEGCGSDDCVVGIHACGNVIINMDSDLTPERLGFLRHAWITVDLLGEKRTRFGIKGRIACTNRSGWCDGATREDCWDSVNCEDCLRRLEQLGLRERA